MSQQRGGVDQHFSLHSFQSLFQLPQFRRLVLSYSFPPNVLESCRTRTVSFHHVKLGSFPLVLSCFAVSLSRLHWEQAIPDLWLYVNDF